MENDRSILIPFIPAMLLVLIVCTMQFISMNNCILSQKQEIDYLRTEHPSEIEKLEDDVDTLRRTNIELSEKNKQLTLRLNNAKP